MPGDMHPLDYSPTDDEPATSWLAVASVIVGILAFPCIANVLLPSAVRALLPHGTRRSMPPIHLLVLPGVSLLLGLLAAISIGTSRGKRRGMILALCGVALALCWCGVVVVVWLMTRNLKFGPAD